jgi:hypothetical protein
MQQLLYRRADSVCRFGDEPWIFEQPLGSGQIG